MIFAIQGKGDSPFCYSERMLGISIFLFLA